MAPTFKQDAMRLVESLPEGSTWDDLMQAIYERIVVEKSFEDVREGRTMTHDEVRARFGFRA